MMRAAITRLELRELAFGYAGQAPVFEHLNLIFPDDPAVWLRTAGGRGRSTLLKILSGLVTPQKGGYLINGQDVKEMPFQEFLKLRLNMGYGFDLHGLLNNKSLFENLLFPLEFHRMIDHVAAAERVQDLIDRFNLGAIQDLRPFAVTGSERKLTCVLRAFVHHPQIVFLDDPFVGLKHHMVDELIKYVGELRGKGLKQIVFAAEAGETAERLAPTQLWVGEKRVELKRVG